MSERKDCGYRNERAPTVGNITRILLLPYYYLCATFRGYDDDGGFVVSVLCVCMYIVYRKFRVEDSGCAFILCVYVGIARVLRYA